MDTTPRQLMRDLRRARREGPAGLRRRQSERLSALYRHAKSASPFYRQLYDGLPAEVTDASALPPTGKAELMAHFDDWVADPRVTLATARTFLADPELIGRPFAGQYLLISSSGTSGQPGIFLQDRYYDAVSQALQGQFIVSSLGLRGVARLLLKGQRIAALFAVGGHYAGYANARRTLLTDPSAAKKLRVFSVHLPVAELVAQLNEYRPAALVGYAGTIALLAAEQAAGRLRVRPALVMATAEGLGPEQYRSLERVFDARVRNSYGCSEFAYAAFGCGEGWLHVNSDWVILEPVDADLRPTPPGELSDTVLLTNLTNRVQSILRYDLGDRMLLRPDACPCGSPLPAVRAVGRAHETLTLTRTDGGTVDIDVLALTSLADRVPGIERFQLVHAGPDLLRVRLLLSADGDSDRVWPVLQGHLCDLLRSRGATAARVELDADPPRPSAGGKYVEYVPLDPALS